MTLPLNAASAGSQTGRRIAGAALLAMVLLGQVAGKPGRAQDADPFSATVKVDASADTVVKAREAARIDGQRQALAAVAARLSGGASAEPPRLDDKAITDLVASFEVANERMSAVRYVADYTFHFRPAETRRVLGVTATAAGERSGSPNPAESNATATVIIPVFELAGQAALWDDPNPWREAWEHAPTVSGRAIVPLGDAGDLAAIDAEQALAGNADAIAAVARRNGGDAAIVAVATLQGSSDRPSGLDVQLRRFRSGHLVDTHSENYIANPGESATDLLRRAVTAVAPDIVVSREETLTSAVQVQDQTLTAVLPIDSLEDWLRARQRLRSLPVIRRVTVAALSRQEATIAIDYTGTIEQLKSDLAKIRLDLVRRELQWQLARGGAQ